MSDFTLFAPAERADPQTVLRDAMRLSSEALIAHLTGTLPCVMMILNRQRQVIYKNQRLSEMLGNPPDDEIIGKRPGELLECIHAHKTESGCGTTEFCRECGAAKAIMGSQRNQTVSIKECLITTTRGTVFNFRIWSSPFIYQNTRFTICCVENIEDQKRREVLEKIFLHDMNNILTVVSGYAELLQPDGSYEMSRQVSNIQAACRQLTEEIAAHQKILAAENKTLSLALVPCRPKQLIADVTDLFLADIRDSRLILPSSIPEKLEIVTDRTLLLRVLRNMVKNALEAVPQTGPVQIGFEYNEFSCIFSVHNGAAMSRSVQRQVFQRSFSTKGKGRGLGTYSMKLFGEQYLKGAVWFSSSEETGTDFYISVPVQHPDA